MSQTGTPDSTAATPHLRGCVQCSPLPVRCGALLHCQATPHAQKWMTPSHPGCGWWGLAGGCGCGGSVSGAGGRCHGSGVAVVSEGE